MSGQIDFPMESGTHPLRQCALVLHSIGREDRQWLLANLKGALVPQLEQLLTELQALGIPAHPGLARTSSDVRRSRANDLGKLLRDEPAGLIAAVMRPREGAERNAVLSHLRAAKRLRVQARMSSADATGQRAALAPRAAQALEAQLSTRLARMRELPAPERGAARFMQLTRRWLRFTRSGA